LHKSAAYHGANLICLLLASVLLAAGTSCGHRPPKFDTEYQVVVFTNGQVMIGRLEGLDTKYPVLREAYSVQVVPANDQSNPRNVNTMLVSRSREAHAPAFTVLVPRNILLIEPVTKGSRMEDLIARERNAAAQGK
jgi:hypothetical protein